MISTVQKATMADPIVQGSPFPTLSDRVIASLMHVPFDECIDAHYARYLTGKIMKQCQKCH